MYESRDSNNHDHQLITSKRPTTYSTFDGTGNDGKNIFFFYFDGGILNHIKPWAKDPAWKQITQSWILATPSVHTFAFLFVWFLQCAYQTSCIQNKDVPCFNSDT